MTKSSLSQGLDTASLAARLRGFQPEIELSAAFRLKLRTELAALAIKTPVLAA